MWWLRKREISQLAGDERHAGAEREEDGHDQVGVRDIGAGKTHKDFQLPYKEKHSTKAQESEGERCTEQEHVPR
jgi:hypothetical protein